MHLLNKPEVMIGNAHEKFDTNGKLTDENTEELIKSLLVNLYAWTNKLNAKQCR
jgi:chromate reductase, NAD(P)H dehydrogenase (quinone)